MCLKKTAVLLLSLLLFLTHLFFAQIAGAELPTKEALTTPETYSYLLLEEAGKKSGTESIKLIKEAIRVSPNDPAPYFELFYKTLSLHPQEFFHSLNHLFKGITAYSRSFWWFFNLTGILSGALLTALILISIIIALTRLPLDIPLMAHEIQENARTSSYLLVLIPSLLGPYYFLASLCFLSFLHLKGRPRYAGYLLLLALMFAPLPTVYLSSYLAASSSPEIKAAVAVNEGRSNVYAIETLKDKEAIPLKFSYAIALWREGRIRAAAEEYRQLISLKKDPRFYINLGNCYAAMKRLDKAMDMYKTSISIKPLPSAYYNLSMLARDKLDFTAGDKYFQQASNMDFNRIAQFRELRNDTKTLALMGEGLSTKELFLFALGRGLKDVKLFSLNGPLVLMAFSLLLIVMLFMSGDSTAMAMRCQKCGKLYCVACERRMPRGGMCTECFRSMISFESNPAERVDTIVKTHNYLKKRRRILSILSFTIPGITLLYGGRVFSGIIFSFIFLFSASALILSEFFTFNIYPYNHIWLTFVLSLILILSYLSGNLYTIGRLKKGWL
jgi:tetratricopeptide (TPR) repeat protein